MKKLVIASVVSILSGAVLAVPTDSGERSYSYQGKPVRVNVIHRPRNIPAPSSWTPPERIPSPRVAYVRREQPKRVGGSGFSSPTFSNPSFSNPNFSSPGFSNPSYSSPTYSSPTYASPTYGSPSYSSPIYSSPSYSSPSYASPSFR